MPSTQSSPATSPAVLDAARTGDEQAFAELVGPYRSELRAHCYRMLGSVYDAEDALQDALLRAWKALARFEGRSSLRSWLYTIATNTCLDEIARRPKRILPVDHGPRTDPFDGPGSPLVESTWVEPYPDEHLSLADGPAGPEARYELRESVELAFVVALQHLPANQRAVLIMREVLGFSAAEVAESLETTVASVNSALQRARKSIEERTPEQTQQTTLRNLGDEAVAALVTRYVDAWEQGDVDAVVGLLAEDVTFAMPPLASWFGGPQGGRAEVRDFLAGYPISGAWEWKAIPTTANGQLALAYYSRAAGDAGPHLPFALNVLTLRGAGEIADVVAFVVRAIDATDRAAYHRWVDEPTDEARLKGTFKAFGLPAELA